MTYREIVYACMDLLKFSSDDNYYTEEELFNKFKEYNFEVNSILDIKNNQNIQYEIKMEYRNRR